MVFVLVGFWHGANWTFLVWGLYHGALLVIERGFALGGTPAVRVARVGRRALTLLLVVIGWVFFRAATLPQALAMLGHMFVPDVRGLSDAVDATLTNQRTGHPAGVAAGRAVADAARSRGGCWSRHGAGRPRTSGSG